MDNIALDANNNRSSMMSKDENVLCNIASLPSATLPPTAATSSTLSPSSSSSSSSSSTVSSTIVGSYAQSSSTQSYLLPFNGTSPSVLFDKSSALSFDYCDTGSMNLLPSAPVVNHLSSVPLNTAGPLTLWSKMPGTCTTNYSQCNVGSNDSSYDSDQDSNQNSCSDLAQLVDNLVDSGNSTTPEYETNNDGFNSHQCSIPTTRHCTTKSFHEEINRTNSETLGQEYREYVTRSMHPGSANPALQPADTKVIDSNESCSSDDENDEQFDITLLNDPTNYASYDSNLNYALKLGYSKRQLQKAITKLGFDVEKNELLEELIRISDLDGSFMKSNHNLNSSAQDYNHIQRTIPPKTNNLRPIIIDGSNVAISHGNKEFYSCKGIAIVVQWFRSRGHDEITAFVPKWRYQETFKHQIPIKDREILEQLMSEKVINLVPSRTVDGKLMACHDDRYILNLAVANNGIVVSNDNYRDLASEKEEYSRVIKERLLMYSFVNDEFMPPDDPLGRNGPRLSAFLRFNIKYQQLCPYDKRCTFGTKCRYLHPERDPRATHKPIAERISESANKRSKGKIPLKSMNSLPVQLHSSIESNDSSSFLNSGKKVLSRTKSTFPDIPSTISSGKNMTNSSIQKVSNAPVQKERTHQKLNRQLSLNPVSDPRLSQLQASTSRIQSSKNMNNKQMLSQTKSCGGGIFNSFDLPTNHHLSTMSVPQSQPNRQFSHSTRNLNGDIFGGMNSYQQPQQRHSYLHFQQHQQQHQQQQQQQQQQNLQNRLVKSLSLCSSSQVSYSTNPQSHYSSKHFSSASNSSIGNLNGTVTNALDISKMSMPSVTITPETPVSSSNGCGSSTFDAFNVVQPSSNHQFASGRSVKQLQQSHSFSAITPPAATNTSIRSNPTVGVYTPSSSSLASGAIQSHHYSTQSFSTQSLSPIGRGTNPVPTSIPQNSGLCSPVVSTHQIVSRNLSAPETTHQQLPGQNQQQQQQRLHPANHSASTGRSGEQSFAQQMALSTMNLSATNDWPTFKPGNGNSFDSANLPMDEQHKVSFIVIVSQCKCQSGNGNVGSD